jgi:hypothetical protein
VITPSKRAHDALYELVGEGDDEPLALRVNQALKRPLVFASILFTKLYSFYKTVANQS